MRLSLTETGQLQKLMEIFLQENQKLNLSAYRTEEQCWAGNILDSIEGIREEEFRERNTVIDVGIGGGFPLLPLAILFPNVQCTGLDATKKKVDAVQRIVNQLGLQNVELFVGRAESLGHVDELREQFDFVLGRAVAPLATLLELLSPFARVGGNVICWKSLSIEKELLASITAREQLKCRLVEKRPYSLPEDWGERQLLFFQKTAALPREFPRAVGIPKKKPL